jgi:hypothetical protein
MKLTIMLAAAIISGAAAAVGPSFGQAVPHAGAQVAAVQQEVQTLKRSIEAFRTACQNGDVAAAKSALKQIADGWKALPPAAKARIAANRPELVERLAALKQVPQELQALKGAVQTVRAAKAKGDRAAAKAALPEVVADFKALPPALKVLIARSHPEWVQKIQAWRR